MATCDVQVIITDRSGNPGSPLALDKAVANFSRELALLPGVRATSGGTPAPPGARSGTMATVGALVVAGLTSGTIKAFVELTKAWLDAWRRSGQEATITVSGASGTLVTIKGGRMSPEDIAAAVKTLQQVINSVAPPASSPPAP
jgi:hypothetical protein